MRFGLSVITIFSSILSANEIGHRMPDVVLDAIKHCECLKESDGSCNPHVIRINSKDEAALAAQAGYEVSGHIIRCGDTSYCSVLAKSLIDGGITNLDLGPYQINYKYHPNPQLHEYFEEPIARERANSILSKLVNAFGYSWETLGRYHHFNPKDKTRNQTYYMKMYAYINQAGGLGSTE